MTIRIKEKEENVQNLLREKAVLFHLFIRIKNINRNNLVKNKARNKCRNSFKKRISKNKKGKKKI